MEVSRAAAEFNSGLKDYDRRGSVDVIIAIDEDAFFAGNGRCQAIHRHLHAGHGIRRMQAQERRRKKIPRGLRIGDVTGQQQSGHDGCKFALEPQSGICVQRLRKILDLSGFSGKQIPAHG